MIKISKNTIRMVLHSCGSDQEV